MSAVQRPSTQYAFFYPEGAGYLHIKNLTPGSQGSTALVLSCADYRLYVRKRGLIEERNSTGTSGDYGCDEVYLYRSHPLFPQLIDWTIYHPLRRSDPDYSRHLSTSTIWELCSGGDLGGLIRRYIKLNAGRFNYIRGMFPYPVCIPEAFIWKAFGQLIQAVSFLHHSRPLVVHQDIFHGNIFLRPNKNTSLFDCCLGDFGKAAAHPPIIDNQYAIGLSRLRNQRILDRLMSDYADVVDVVKQLMTLEEGSWLQDSHGNNSNSGLHAIFDRLEFDSTSTIGSQYDAEAFQWTSEFSVRQDMANREAFQIRNRMSGKRYSPLLFDTIRQFERRLELVRGEETDQNFFVNFRGGPSEGLMNRDWSYLGKAIEERAGQRMGPPGLALYPPVDDTWARVVLSITNDIQPDTIRKAMFYSKTGITDAEAEYIPAGPFRIAKVDYQSLRVLGTSRETYNTFDSLNTDRTRDSRLENRIKGNSEHSVVSDPTQVDGVFTSRQLDRDALRSG